jgi:hypothetical protein
MFIKAPADSLSLNHYNGARSATDIPQYRSQDAADGSGVEFDDELCYAAEVHGKSA